MLMVNHLVGFGAARRASPSSSAATWDAAAKGANYTLSGGGLIASGAGDGTVLATVALSGARYWEVVATTVSDAQIGIATGAAALGQPLAVDVHGHAYRNDGQKMTAASPTSYGNPYYGGSIVGVAFDADAGKLWFSLGGVWQGGGDPAAGTGAAYSGLSGTFRPAVGSGSGTSASFTARFSPASWTHAAPSGFSAIP